MELLIQEHAAHGPHLVLLFGRGLIGSAVSESLCRQQFRAVAALPVDWRQPGRLAGAADLLRRTAAQLDTPPAQISLVWSAGISNFFSTGQATEHEQRSFDEVLGLAGEAQRVAPAARCTFHFFSSAGGLFEGQKSVTATSQPAPRRPYGQMKMRQEDQVRSAFAQGDIAIYRPSSVYGPMTRLRKHGLINHLIANAGNQRTSVLDANVMALRDYVYAGDIGRYVANRIAGRDRQEPVQFLVSARCASIFEVVSRIERILKLKVRYRFDEAFGNSASITFSGHVLPPGWRPSTLDVGIRQFMLRDRPQSLVIRSEEPGRH